MSAYRIFFREIIGGDLVMHDVGLPLCTWLLGYFVEARVKARNLPHFLPTD